MVLQGSLSAHTPGKTYLVIAIPLNANRFVIAEFYCPLRSFLVISFRLGVERGPDDWEINPDLRMIPPVHVFNVWYNHGEALPVWIMLPSNGYTYLIQTSYHYTIFINNDRWQILGPQVQFWRAEVSIAISSIMIVRLTYSRSQSRP